MPNSDIQKYNNNNDPVAVIWDQFLSAMQALQLQDTQTSEQAFVKAKLVYKSIKDEDAVEPWENEFLRILVNYIEVISRFLKSVLYTNDERHKKAMDELVLAKQICEDATESFKKFSPDEIKDFDEQGGSFSILKFMYVYLEHMILVMHGITQKSLETKEGKYVNEVEVNRLAAAELRNFQAQGEYSTKDEVTNTIAGIMGMLARMAEIYDRKAERLEENRKTIEFMKPIDKKVFIIHGHNEALLRELEIMLTKEFKIDPIILKDESDKGNTIIEKLEDYGRLCAFAFAIVTPDDIVENKKQKSFQARPNVLYELGWFSGRFGRSKVRILRQKDTALPSDLSGLVNIDFNEKLEEVFRKIKADLETAGIIP